METLKKILVVNALTSAITGLLLMVVARNIARIFAINNEWPFIFVGLFLLLFALLVLYTGMSKKLNIALVWSVIYLDTSWVLISLAISIGKAFNLSAIGYILIVVVAAWVALMAYLQHNYLMKMIRKKKLLA